MDEVTLTLDSPMTEEQWDMIADYDFNYTNEITFHTKHGKTVRFVKESAQPEIIRCKDCKYQEKHFYEDRRRKDGGHYIYGCELAEGYSHVCLDDDFCSRADKREGGGQIE